MTTMNKIFVLALFGTLPAHADITYIQETYPGTPIMTGRGYITTPITPNYTRVTPTQNGTVDTSRPGYVIGPTIGQDDPLSNHSLRAGITAVMTATRRLMIQA